MDGNEIGLKDLFEKMVKIETLLENIIKGLPVVESVIIDTESPYYNPDTKMYDMKYYKEQIAVEKSKKKLGE